MAQLGGFGAVGTRHDMGQMQAMPSSRSQGMHYQLVAVECAFPVGFGPEKVS